MALTEQEEKQLKDGLTAANAALEALKPLAGQVTDLTAKLAKKDEEIAALSKGQAASAEDRAISDLKSKYHSVPEDTLRALPADKREEHAKKLHEAFSKVTPAGDPLEAWAKAGGVGANIDLESEAQRIERDKAKNEAVKNGDARGVMVAKGKDITRFVMNSIFKK